MSIQFTDSILYLPLTTILLAMQDFIKLYDRYHMKAVEYLFTVLCIDAMYCFKEVFQ